MGTAVAAFALAALVAGAVFVLSALVAAFALAALVAGAAFALAALVAGAAVVLAAFVLTARVPTAFVVTAFVLAAFAGPVPATAVRATVVLRFVAEVAARTPVAAAVAAFATVARETRGPRGAACRPVWEVGVVPDRCAFPWRCVGTDERESGAPVSRRSWPCELMHLTSVGGHC